MDYLDRWQEAGWSSMQAMAQHCGMEELETVAEIQAEVEREGISDNERTALQNERDYHQGMLSRLD